jgi:plasmid stabilization system protein ParE
MKSSCTITEQGLPDIEDIVRYIAEDNVQAALEVEGDFYDAFDLIAENPRIGHLKPEWTEKPYRFWTVRNHYSQINIFLYSAAAKSLRFSLKHGRLCILISLRV